MKPLFVAVLLAIMQAPSPIPRKAANQPTKGSQNVEGNASNQQNASSISEGDQDKGKAQAPHDARETIIIREPAAVSRKDAWDKAYVIFTGVLVLVGGLGIFLARRTLKAIERQGLSMRRQTVHLRNSVAAARRSARAALLSAQAVINAERAWVDISFDVEGAGKHSLAVANIGKSPAFITEVALGRGYWGTGDDVPLGSIGSVVPERTKMYNILAAGDRKPILSFDVFSYPAAEDGHVATYHAHASYKDIFGQEHRTEVLYRREKPGRLVYLPKYTRYITKTKQGEKAN